MPACTVAEKSHSILPITLSNLVISNLNISNLDFLLYFVHSHSQTAVVHIAICDSGKETCVLMAVKRSVTIKSEAWP